MQKYANVCQKFTKIMQNGAKTCPFSPKNHLFCFKNRSNRHFNPWKCAVSWCAWKCPKWILNVLMNFYEGLDDFCPFLGNFRPFWPFVNHFWPYLGRSPTPDPHQAAGRLAHRNRNPRPLFAPFCIFAFLRKFTWLLSSFFFSVLQTFLGHFGHFWLHPWL